MAHRQHSNAFDDTMELLIENGFEGMAEVLTILLNQAQRDRVFCAKAIMDILDEAPKTNA